METRNSPNRKKLYESAEQQAGYFTSRQAREAGYTYPLLTYHCRVGDYLRAARGVYRLTQFPELPFGDLFAAWLRAGPRAVVSHESALSVYEISDVLPSEIHLTVPRQASQRRRGIRQHTSHLPPGDVTRRAGLPVTTVPRTISDAILSGIPQEQIQRAIHESLDRGLVSRTTLESYAERRGGKVARVVKVALRRENKI
jgi:predicted transcriptional regulator of viral defense system